MARGGGCCDGCDAMFGEKGARRALARYLKHGLGGEESTLAGWASSGGLEGATVLEVGGGIGQLQAELLRRGASTGTIVELSAAYEPFAAELAAAVGVAGRSSFVLADLTADGDDVPAADVVVLRRVVCCSPRGVELLGAAAARTRRVLVASYPRRSWWVRAVVRLQNAGFALLRREFRVYVHDPAALAAAAGAEGLTRSRHGRGVVWESVAFARSR
jgi:magnesium-protoporphyrin O-methyltransferase